MIVYNDKLGVQRALEFAPSYCGKYITMIMSTDKRNTSDALQIPIHHIDEIIEMLNKLKDKK